MRIPNELPQITLPQKVAFISYAPTSQDSEHGRPLVGSLGDIVFGAARQAGIVRSASFVGFYNYNYNDASQWSLNNSKLDLKEALDKFDPNICVLLGDRMARAAGFTIPKKDGDDVGIDRVRGTMFICNQPDNPLFGRKCIITYDPSDVMVRYERFPLLRFDLSRAYSEATSPTLDLPSRRLLTHLTPAQYIDWLKAIKPGQWTSVDIEGWIHTGITCIAFSIDPLEAISIPVEEYDSDTLAPVVKAIAAVCSDPDIPLVGQNFTYDMQVLATQWGVRCRNIVHDTLIAIAELEPELPRNLGTQASIFTKEPFYKHEISSKNKQVYYEYNAKDAAVTLEIALAQRALLDQLPQPAQDHYQTSLALQFPTMFMGAKGVRMNREAIEREIPMLASQQAEYQAMIDTLAGVKLNCNSPKQLCDVLYNRLSFPRQYQMEGRRKTSKLTADKGALLKLYTSSDSQLIYCILKWKQLEGFRKQLEAEIPAGDRIHASTQVAGTITFRMSCSKWLDKTGINMQTAMKDIREYYIPDEGYFIGQLDLAGADGWTIAAECTALGDPTMLLDYKAGLKPAKIIASLYTLGTQIASASQQEMAEFCRQTEAHHKAAGSWEFLYFACKKAQHSTNYQTSPTTMAQNVLEDSWKYLPEPVTITVAEAAKLQQFYKLRYPGLETWQQSVISKIKTTGKLTAASGHTRNFLGRLHDSGTHRSGLSQNPQHNTSYAINLGILRLWRHPENVHPTFPRRLLVEPLIQVHDALVFQFPQHYTNLAVPLIRTCFDNPITIANTTLTIPYEGAYGTSWKALEVGTI